jgi:hypothetical protein
MSILETLKSEFHSAFPRLASGKYIHFLMLRHSQSFPVFKRMVFSILQERKLDSMLKI